MQLWVKNLEIFGKKNEKILEQLLITPSYESISTISYCNLKI